MNQKPLILLVLILLLLPVVVTAQSGSDGNDEISDNEKKELFAFTKRAIAEMQKTRDVTPLLKKFFVPITGLSVFIVGDDHIEGSYKPNSSESTRLAITGMNYGYALSLSMIMQDGEYRANLGSIVPPRLGSSLEKSYDRIGDAIDDNNPRRFRAELPRWEHHQKAVRDYLRRKNFERTAKYRGVIADREKEGMYRYDIDQLSCDTDAKDSMACWVLRFGPDTRLYQVATPYGLAAMIVKIKNRYKMLFLLPHPMTS